jgi:hypothetical protein
VKACEFNRYDINVYNIRTTKLDANCPLATITNIRVVTRVVDPSKNVTDYYGVLQKIIKYTLEGAKELRVVFLL